MAKPKEYQDFSELSSRRKRGVDFITEFENRGSKCAVIAPHGGKIEPFTEKLALEIAGNNISYYTFKTISKFEEGRTDHITSTKFDDPDAMDILKEVDWVLTIHGRQDRDDPRTIWIGGLDERRRKALHENFEKNEICARVELETHPGLNKNNICNKGRHCMGVQLEIPSTLRAEMKQNKILRDRFANSCIKLAN